jgi:DNA-binding SARP family transcriptional activator
MEFRILGSLQVFDDGVPIEIAGTKQQVVLALLVLRANEMVRSERLIDELWGEHAPRNAAGALYNHVSRLRKALGPDVLGRREWGYVLRTPPESIDLRRFETMLAESEPLPALERAQKLNDALALWRGPPLAGLESEPAVQREIARLEDLRVGAIERRIDADLEAGRTSDLAGELGSLIAQHPMREHLRWQLILSLYRAGRQAEALEIYRETRRVLAEELGLEPSLELRELERAILRQDPSLAIAAAPPPAPPSERPRTPSRRRPLLGGLAVLLGLGIAAVVALKPAPNEASTTTKYVTIADNFNRRYLDPTVWGGIQRTDRNVSILDTGRRLQIAVGARAKPGVSTAGNRVIIDIHVGTACSFPGDFDARVDYTMLNWPVGDGVLAFLDSADAGGAVGRESLRTGDGYLGWVVPDGNSNAVQLSDRSGSLRIARVKGVETVYFLHHGSWATLAGGHSSSHRAIPVLGMITSDAPDRPFGHQEARVAFDNFVVTGANPNCPP